MISLNSEWNRIPHSSGPHMGMIPVRSQPEARHRRHLQRSRHSGTLRGSSSPAHQLCHGQTQLVVWIGLKAAGLHMVAATICWMIWNG